MEKLYKTDKHNWLARATIFFPLAIILLTLFFYKEFYYSRPYNFIFLINLIFPIWVYFDNSYKIADGYFHFRFGYNKGRIDIDKIREIGPGRFKWPGQKAALATKGLVLKYNTYDDIFIAPEDRQLFINDLLQINPSIQVSYPQEETEKTV